MEQEQLEFKLTCSHCGEVWENEYHKCEICQKCKAVSLVSISSKSSDLNFFRHLHREHDGYVLRDMGIGSGDYVEFTFCVNCGQIQGNWPKKIHGKIVTRKTHGYKEGHLPGKENE